MVLTGVASPFATSEAPAFCRGTFSLDCGLLTGEPTLPHLIEIPLTNSNDTLFP